MFDAGEFGANTGPFGTDGSDLGLQLVFVPCRIAELINIAIFLRVKFLEPGGQASLNALLYGQLVKQSVINSAGDRLAEVISQAYAGVVAL